MVANVLTNQEDTAVFVRLIRIDIKKNFVIVNIFSPKKGPAGYTGNSCEFCDACIPNPCNNGGQCQSSGVTGGFRCACPPGFLGRLCEDRDPCYNNGPCGTYGRCVATINGNARCECLPGYLGTTCDTKDSCSPNPCKFGQCLNQGDSFVCQCPPEYSGQRCENKDPCNPNPCINGQCVNQGNKPNFFSLIKFDYKFNI